MADEKAIQCAADAGFSEWMSRLNGSVVVTTYQAGKVIMLGWDGSKVSVLLRNFERPMGLAVSPPTPEKPTRLVLATKHSVILFADAPNLAESVFPSQPKGQYDALYLPRITYYTGDVSAHDLAFGKDGLWLINTRFSCIVRLSDAFSFIPVWKPPFVSEIVPEDRCHLNGLALVDGVVRYVTCLGETDEAGTWRTKKVTGGIILDVRSGEVVTRGLAMPHSPRWYDNKLWVLNSGCGELLLVDPKDGKTQVVCVLPGYLRGMCFVGPFALIALSRIREEHLFAGLPVQTLFPDLLCGVAVIDLRSGKKVGWIGFTEGCTELYEVGVIPGGRRPMIMNLDREESKNAILAPNSVIGYAPRKRTKARLLSTPRRQPHPKHQFPEARRQGTGDRGIWIWCLLSLVSCPLSPVS